MCVGAIKRLRDDCVELAKCIEPQANTTTNTHTYTYTSMYIHTVQALLNFSDRTQTIRVILSDSIVTCVWQFLRVKFNEARIIGSMKFMRPRNGPRKCASLLCCVHALLLLLWPLPTVTLSLLWLELLIATY